MMRFIGATAEVRRRNGFEGIRFLCTKPDMDLLMNLYDFEKEALARAAKGEKSFQGKYDKKYKGLFANPRPVAPPKLGLREEFNPTVEVDTATMQNGKFSI